MVLVESSGRRPATIREVASLAGVGLGTVSRVLNNHGSVSDGTRRRVESAIEQLRYQPNLQARRLVRGKTETVGFVLGNRDFLDPFHAKMLCGAQRYFAQTGHHVVYTALDYSPDGSADEIVLPKIISLRGVLDGVIVAGTNYTNLLAALDRIGLPYVIFGNNLVSDNGGTNRDTVSFDDTGGAAELTERLIGLGHEHIWYIGHTALPWFRRRYEGYAGAMKAHGFRPRVCSGIQAETSTQFGHVALTELVDAAQKITAACCGNDAVAFGAAKAAREKGLNVPADISIAGFDDREICFLTDPALSTVRPFLEDVGAQCAKALLSKLNGAQGPSPEVVIPTEVVMRGSTGPCKSSVKGSAAS